MAVTVVTERDVELVQKIEGEIGVKLVELELPEETVLEDLNRVSLARRMATMVSIFDVVGFERILTGRKCTILGLGNDKLPIRQRLSREREGMLRRLDTVALNIII